MGRAVFIGPIWVLFRSVAWTYIALLNDRDVRVLDRRLVQCFTA